MPGVAAMQAKTVDISMGGVSIIVGEQIPVGHICTIAVDTLLNGKVVRVTAVGRVIYSILKGTDGYRTGLQFIQIDAANNRMLAELMI